MIKFKPIEYHIAIDFLLPRHYSGRKPVVSYAFGAYEDNILKAVCTFGKPASQKPCWCCGKENEPYVIELNRLCRTDDYKKPLSEFVAWCLRQLKSLDKIVISYSDTGMNHHGYIYQACNFLYTGCTKQRTDPWSSKNKHARHLKEEGAGYRKIRTSKHRYIYFCTNKKWLKKQWSEKLVYDILPYPKGDNNKDYELGFVLKDKIVETTKTNMEGLC